MGRDVFCAAGEGLLPAVRGRRLTLTLARAQCEVYPLLMATSIVFEVTREEDGGYSARAVAPDGSIFTQGDTWEELREMALDAVKCHFGEDSAPVEIRLILNELLAVA